MNSIDKSDEKIHLEKTLHLNAQMQNNLLQLRDKLESLLTNVQDTFEANEILIKDGVQKRRKGFGIKGAYLKGGTFYFKGNMFFKDINCRNCPNNEDYENRKKENEIFPMDFNLKARHMWSLTDKQGVILGIKEQIIDYLTQPSKKRTEKSEEINSEKLAKLLKMVPDNFRIDWEYVSSCNLNHRHSAKNCEAIWNLFLHPSLNRSSWSEKENHKLLEVAGKYKFQNWQEIAKECGQRSDFQCFVQYKNHVCHMIPETYTKWRKEDDKLLLEAVAKNTVNGNINWSNVQSYFPHKAKTTIHSRYNLTINPNIVRGVLFTPEEDVLLIAAVKEYGKFSCIPRSLFPNRSCIQLRSHYKNTLCKRHKLQPWTLEDDIKLMDFVNKNGPKSWTECEKVLEGRHARHSCRTRYTTIAKHLAKNPEISIETLPRKRVITPPRSSVSIQNWKEKVDEISNHNSNGQNITDGEKQRPDEVDKQRRKKADDAEKPMKIRKKLNKTAKTRKSPKEKSDAAMSIKTKKLETAVKIENCPEEQKQTKQKREKIKQQVPKERKPRTKKNEDKIEKGYVARLKAYERNCYDFFKYAYNFEMNKHPCQNIQINNTDFSMALSALKPMYTEEALYNLTAGIAQYIKQDIIRNPIILPTSKTINTLPPSWSTAMGFRALCINTADITSNLPPNYPSISTNNEQIQRFRERLRLIFYSTALLSRLNPSMVGIITSGLIRLESRPLKRKRCSIKDISSGDNNNSMHLNKIIKTEMEM